MNLRTKIFVIIYLAFSLTIYAQYFPANVNAASSPVEHGLPDLGTAKFSVKTVNPSFAWINPGSGLSGLYFIADHAAKDKYKFWIEAVYADGETSIHPIKMKSNQSGNYAGSIDLENGENTQSRGLSLLFDPAGEVLFYSRTSPGENISVVPIITAGKPVSGLLLTKANGSSFDINQYEGKVVVLNWLANHKIPGLDRMNSLLKKFGGDSMTVFISASEKGVPSGSGASGNLMNYISAFASGEAIKRLGPDKPQTIIIGRDGVVKFCQPAGDGFKYNAVDSVLNALSGK